MYYFAYGSNMNKQQMIKRCPGARLYGVGVLKNYSLDFTISSPERWSGGGCADVVFFPGREVWGLLYEVTSVEEEKLDKAEGSRYQKIYKTIMMDGDKDIDSFLYEVVSKAPFKRPAVQYINLIKNAALENNFPEAYVSFLESIEVVE